MKDITFVFIIILTYIVVCDTFKDFQFMINKVNYTDEMLKTKENPYEYDEIDKYHRRHQHRSISTDRDGSTTRYNETRSPIFDRSDSFLKSQRFRHPQKKCSGTATGSCGSNFGNTSENKTFSLQPDNREMGEKSKALECLKIMRKTPSSPQHSKSDFSCDHYIGKRRNSPCFNDNSFIGWPSESESNSSCDEDETVPLSKIVSTKRSVINKKSLGKLYSSNSKSHCKEDIEITTKKCFDSNIPNTGEHSELSRRRKTSKSKPSKVPKTKILDLANDEVKFTRDDKMNGQHVSKRCVSALSDIHGFQKTISSTLEIKSTTPEKDSDASLKKWLPVTPDLFDSSLSPTGLKLKLTKFTTPETPIDSFRYDNSFTSKVTSPDSPDLIYLGASGPQFPINSPINSPSSRRKRAGVSEIKHHRKKQKIYETLAEDDILQLVEQLNKDEDYAKKLQEEMDKEFALSLAQEETVHQFPAPQLPLPTLPPLNYENNYPFYQQHAWQSPTVLHSHHRVPQFHRRATPNEIDMENHLLALLEETPPRRRGRRGGGRRPTRSRYGVMIQSPVGDGNDYDALLQLAEQMGDVQQKGINNNQIDRLPIKKFKKCDKNEECSICMCEYENNDSMRILPCFHCFHSGCVDKWLKNNASCPVCRVDIKLD